MISLLKKTHRKVFVSILLITMMFTHFMTNTKSVKALEAPTTTTVTGMNSTYTATLKKGWTTLEVNYGYLTDDQGNILYCVQPFRVHSDSAHSGSEWTGYISGGKIDLPGFAGDASEEAVQLSQAQKKHLEKAAMFAQMNGSRSYLEFMGLYTWETIGWNVESISGGQSAAYQNFKADINAKINALDAGVSFNKSSYTLKVGESVTLTDTNNNLQYLEVPSELNGYKLVANGNQLTITATENSSDGALVFKPDATFRDYQGTSFLYKTPHRSQELTLFKVKDPIRLNINLNAIKNDSVRVLKINENGNAEADVVYGLYSDANAATLIKQATTNENGVADFGEISLNYVKVYVKEISAPKHLVLSDEIKEVVLVGGQTHEVKFTNNFVREDIELIKVNEKGQPEANVVVGLYSDANATQKLQEVTTDGQGKGTFSNVSVGYGKVYAKEISVPEHLVLSDEIKEITLVPGEKHSVSFTNKFVRVNVNLIKVNDEGNPEAGVVIGVYSDPQATNLIQQAETDAEGKGLFTDLSVDLGTVYVKEISVPAHLVLNDEIKEVTLTPKGVHEVKFVNEQVRGQVQIVKVDSNNEEIPIEGAVFGVYKANTDELVEKITSDRDGFAFSSLLKYGDYYAQELEAPESYYLNPNKYPFSIREHGKVVVKYIANDQVLVKLQVIKSDADTAEPLEGVEFIVRNVATGQVVEFEYLNDNYELVTQTNLVTNAKGEAFTRGFLKYGDYELVEVKAKPGYLTIDPIPFTINRDTETVDLKVIGRTKVQPVSNSKTTTEIIKQDVYGTVLPGATLKLVEKETGKEIAQWVSSDAAMVIRGLEFNKTYTLIEVTAPEGYFVANPVDFVINADKTTTKVVMEDEKIPTIHTTATVNGAKEVETIGTLTLTDKVSYKDLIIGKEYEAKLVWMNKLTKMPFLVDGKPLSTSKKFIPTTSDGEIELSIEVEAKHFVTTVDLVAFENIYKNNIEVAAHADLFDVDQTIKIVRPSLKTKASVAKRDPQDLSKVTIMDKVFYKDLTIGKKYTTKGILMDQATGQPFLDNGKEVTSEITFVATTKDGFVEIPFTINANSLKKGKVVVFEDLYQDGAKLYSHADLSDLEQTVTFTEIKIRKVDSADKNKVLKNAEFTLYLDGQAIQTVVTDEQGIAKFVVENGEYELKETKAPEGYKLSKDAIKVNITGQEVDNMFEVTAQNTLLPSILVNTGTEDSTIYTLAGLGVGATGLVILLSIRRKKEQA